MAKHLVSIVFTDLVKSTAVKSLLPGDDIEARNQAYIATIEEPHRRRIVADLDAAGGRVVKNTGDGFLLIFADPVKAARWSLGVQRSHREAPIATPLGPLEIKIGLHVGAPLANPHDPDDFIGQEVDFAARLCDGASRGQVLISEPAAALIRAAALGEVKIHPHGLRELNGIGRVSIFELLGENQRPRPPAPPAVSPTNLPPPPATFIGRDDLLEKVRGHLRPGGVTVLKGEGGMGKTALALKAAHDALAADGLTGGAAWVNCELEPSKDECLRQMARVFFGDRMEQEPIDVCGRRVVDHLEQGDSLLILDNFETVARDPRLIRWLAGLRPPARVLVTTREHPPGLAGQVVPVHELFPQEARDLFIQRATRAGAATDGQDAEIDQICATVGCQPLAIELLAARAALVPLRRLLERVQRSLNVIDASSDPTRSDRHRTASRCIELSFKELSPSASDLLRRLSVFPDGAGPAVISAVTGKEDWDEAAEELVAASVWRLSGRRYTLHPLVRQVALDQLVNDRGDFEREAALALTQFVCRRAEQSPARQDQTAAVKVVIDWCEAELHNLIATADFAYSAQEWDCVVRLSAAIFDFFQVRGHWSDAEHLYNCALAAARRSNSRPGEAQTKNRLGLVYRQQGRWADAETAHRDSLAIWREIGDRRGEGNTLKHLGRMRQLRQSYDESAAICHQALALLREAGDRVGEAKALTYLGNVYRFDGRWDRAVEVYEQALELSRGIGDRYDEGGLLRHLGQIYHHQGQWDQAKQAFQGSLAIWRGFDDRHNEAVILDNLGAVLRDQGRWGEAESMLEQSLAVFREFGDRRKQGGTLLNLARLRALQGDQASALDLGHQAVATLEHTEDAWLLDRAREFLAGLERR